MLRMMTVLAVLLTALPVFALDLQQARRDGILVEQSDGYVKVAQPSPEADALAKDVNARRLQEYQRISNENGQPVEVVAKLAAEQIAKKLQ